MPILNWLNRDKTIKESAKVPYRLLKAKDEFSYGDKNAENMIIQGDNLDGLKALFPYYAGKVKCIYIDPPYNTKSAFEHYDDNLEHTKWLEMIYPRLEILRSLLAENGIIMVQLDDNEIHYLKVIMDEIFGRKNFIAKFVWRKKAGGGQDSKYIASEHEYIICYQKSNFNFIFNHAEINEKDFNKTLNSRKCKFTKLEKWGSSSYKEDRPSLFYPIKDPNGNDYFPKAPDGKDGRWRAKPEKLEEDEITWINRNGKLIPYEVTYYDAVKQNTKIVKERSILYDVASTTDAARDISSLFGKKNFDTPKPEKLIQKLIQLSTNENDLVLDSFLGSGTTAAVAHKMNRRYIGIEMGEHAKTHCVERLKKVVDGEQGGISKSVNWQGGGGFRFYELGEAIFDDQGKINKDIKFEYLAAHIWFSETKTPFIKKDQNNPYSPFLGIHQGVAYYLLYNGILGDKRPHGGNVLTSKILATLEEIKTENFTGAKVIYGETSRIGPAKLLSKKITFKQTPYDIKSR